MENIKTQEQKIKVHVICWDYVEYDREATLSEIEENRKNGYVQGNIKNGITFNFAGALKFKNII